MTLYWYNDSRQRVVFGEGARVELRARLREFIGLVR